MKSKILIGGFAAIAAAYLAYVISIYSHRHLDYISGSYGSLTTGSYRKVGTAGTQLPRALLQDQVQVVQVGDEPFHLADGYGQRLELVSGSDGWYFHQDYKPGGAILFPGLARN